MVVAHWLERLGQMVAPDENYTPEPDVLDTQSSFWNIVAPDPNFSQSPSPRSSQQKKKVTRFESPTTTKDGSTEPLLLCEDCQAKLCASCRMSVAQLESKPTPTSSNTKTKPTTNTLSAMKTPRRSTPRPDPALERRVLSATRETAVVRDMAGTEPGKTNNKLLRMTAVSAGWNDKIKGRVVKNLNKKPELFRARSFNMGVSSGALCFVVFACRLSL